MQVVIIQSRVAVVSGDRSRFVFPVLLLRHATSAHRKLSFWAYTHGRISHASLGRRRPSSLTISIVRLSSSLRSSNLRSWLRINPLTPSISPRSSPSSSRDTLVILATGAKASPGATDDGPASSALENDVDMDVGVVG